MASYDVALEDGRKNLFVLTYNSGVYLNISALLDQVAGDVAISALVATELGEDRLPCVLNKCTFSAINEPFTSS